ncbi:hypothetical protein BIU82_03925 [Arthrobacter sp. SW1]|uniref:glycosyltransferase family 2 protein n=1 Tax=Arthrobacter sp. SW1 TaxID=1920889 RepID=UPI000877E7A2|nr:glycosyltransferase family 2 protein [Arthrobacter sp. SW1]OFI38482.1 hypothetical protein BIU82_03925 [Arthrobacter sp. SW1]
MARDYGTADAAEREVLELSEQLNSTTHWYTRRPRRIPGVPRRREQPAVHPAPAPGSIFGGNLALVLTAVAWLTYVFTTAFGLLLAPSGSPPAAWLEAGLAVLLVTLLTFSAVSYILARNGALRRFRAHRPFSSSALHEHFRQVPASMAVLVPSYAEEPDIVAATLFSAALQEFPDVSVVLLIDDKPEPATAADRARLEATRRLPLELEERLRGPRERAEALAGRLKSIHAESTSDKAPAACCADAAREFASAASWLESAGASWPVTSHEAAFFVRNVLGSLAEDFREIAGALDLAAKAPRRFPVTKTALENLARRLLWVFRARVTSFERKLFSQLSHEPNKAMNLNSYIGLMGARWDVRVLGGIPGQMRTGAGTGRLPEDGTLEVPDADYVLTLDADSVLLPEYCLRLTRELEAAGNERVAVIQTPYSSFPDAASKIEHIAGATTDLQHLQHQGKTFFDATYWVGANAIIRKRALEDIVETEHADTGSSPQQHGQRPPLKRYIQDRTVIEDTESSIDLAAKGWTLMNYPERLSYSATPPDFGSLVVQRRRWANGGLIILPKLLRTFHERRKLSERIRFGEVLLRVDYLASLAWSSLGGILLLLVPFGRHLLNPLVLAVALPYFVVMGMDLRALGYRFSDVLRIYGFNLVLLPVNAAGVLTSLRQAATGKKIPFARTPKIKDRTAAPMPFVVAPYLLVLCLVLLGLRQLAQEGIFSAIYAFGTAALGMLAIHACIGFRNSVVDVVLGLKLLRRNLRVKTARRGRNGGSERGEELLAR